MTLLKPNGKKKRCCLRCDSRMTAYKVDVVHLRYSDVLRMTKQIHTKCEMCNMEIVFIEFMD